MWLIDLDTEKTISKAVADDYKPSAEELEKFNAFSSLSADEAESRILSIAGDTAEIKIKGTLTNAPDIMAMLFGGGNTTYQEIISAIASAEQNKEILNIVLAVDSPGGDVNGLFMAIDAIARAKKPVKAVVSNLAASAAYALVAQADEIVAVNEATRFGSIGILTTVRLDENKVNITSTKAPNKAPDVTTKEGLATVRESLDAFHDVFVATIASGRRVSADLVNKNFGQGGTLLSREALSKNMIDSISSEVVVTSAAPAITNSFKDSAIDTNNINKINKEDVREGDKAMKVEDFKSENPVGYNAILEEGIAQGKKDELDRIQAHLTMGAGSGDMKTALEAIANGDGMTASITATYHAAGMNRESLSDREGDNPVDAIGGGDGGQASAGSDMEALVFAGVEKHFGLDTKDGGVN